MFRTLAASSVGALAGKWQPNAPVSESEAGQLFGEWQSHFGVNGADYGSWSKTLEEVISHNMVESSWTAGLNEYSHLSWEEFKAQSKSPELQEFFRNLKLDPREGKNLYMLLDPDDKGRVFSQDFIDGCLKLRDPLRALDLEVLASQMCDVNKAIMKKLLRLEGAINPGSLQSGCDSHGGSYSPCESRDLGKTGTGLQGRKYVRGD